MAFQEVLDQSGKVCIIIIIIIIIIIVSNIISFCSFQL